MILESVRVIVGQQVLGKVNSQGMFSYNGGNIYLGDKFVIMMCFYICLCSSSTKAHFEKEKKHKEMHGKAMKVTEWDPKMLYDFTGCLSHIDLTYKVNTCLITHITGVLQHNTECQQQIMQHLPAILMHDHVWQIALEQLELGTR